MSINQLLHKFLGTNEDASRVENNSSAVSGSLSKAIPGGVLGGVAAGGVMSLILGNKGARKVVTKMAGYGGAAVLGGLAYRAYDNWKHQQNEPTEMLAESSFHQYGLASSAVDQQAFELAMVKVMIAAAKSDGHIDSKEQRHIISSIDAMELGPEIRSLLFELLLKDIDLREIPLKLFSTPLKTELYLAALVVLGDMSDLESAFIRKLQDHLEIPPELAWQLRMQVQNPLPRAA